MSDILFLVRRPTRQEDDEEPSLSALDSATDLSVPDGGIDDASLDSFAPPFKANRAEAGGSTRNSTRKKGGPQSLDEAARALFGAPKSEPAAQLGGALSSESQTSLGEASFASLPSDDGFPSMLDRHRRQQDAAVDAFEYATATLAAAPTCDRFFAVWKQLLTQPSLCKWLRRSSSLAAILANIAKVRPYSVECRALQVMIFQCLSEALPPSTLGRFDVLARLREAATSCEIEQPSSPTALAPAAALAVAATPTSHWSRRGSAVPASAAKAAATGSIKSLDDGDAQEVASHIAETWRVEESQVRLDDASLCAPAAARLIKDIVFGALGQDRDVGTDVSNLPSDVLVEAVIAAGVWDAAATTASDSSASTDAIAAPLVAVLEATLCVAKGERALRALQRSSFPLRALYCKVLGGLATAEDPSTPLRHSVSRAFINLTNVLPDGIAELTSNDCGVLVRNAKACLANESDLDGITLACCILLNVLTIRADPLADVIHQHAEEKDRAGTSAQGRRTRIHATMRTVAIQDAELLQSACAKAVAFHETLADEPQDVEKTVCGGYIALMLAALAVGDEDCRVAIVKHLAPALQGRVNDASVRQRPMKYIGAVVQEFVLFQSDAGILTHKALLLMHALSDQLIAENS